MAIEKNKNKMFHTDLRNPSFKIFHTYSIKINIKAFYSHIYIIPDFCRWFNEGDRSKRFIFAFITA